MVGEHQGRGGVGFGKGDGAEARAFKREGEAADAGKEVQMRGFIHSLGKASPSIILRTPGRVPCTKER